MNRRDSSALKNCCEQNKSDPYLLFQPPYDVCPSQYQPPILSPDGGPLQHTPSFVRSRQKSGKSGPDKSSEMSVDTSDPFEQKIDHAPLLHGDGASVERHGGVQVPPSPLFCAWCTPERRSCQRMPKKMCQWTRFPRVKSVPMGPSTRSATCGNRNRPTSGQNRLRLISSASGARFLLICPRGCDSTYLSA